MIKRNVCTVYRLISKSRHILKFIFKEIIVNNKRKHYNSLPWEANTESPIVSDRLHPDAWP